MPARPLYVRDAPTLERVRFDLLDTFDIRPLPANGGLAGIEYDTDFCGTARAWTPPCTPGQEAGQLGVAVDVARTATLQVTGAPTGDYVIDWGDGTVVPALDSPDEAQHTYDADGTYTIRVTGPDGWVGSGTITVTNGVAESFGPWDASFNKIADDGRGMAQGSPIPIYFLGSCRLVGIEESERLAYVERALDLGASRALEEGFGQVIGTGAVDVTTDGPEKVKVGVARLEQFLRRNYGGRGVIHLTAGAALLAIGQGIIGEKNGRLETALGTVVVAGAGYGGLTLPTAPAAGAEWGYATGAVNVWAADVKAIPVTLNVPYDNEFFALAERIYVPTFECVNAAVQIDLEA